MTTVLFAGAVACAFGGALAFAALPPAFGFLGVLAAGITFAIDQGFFDPDAPVIDDGSDPYEVTLTRVTPHRVDGVPGLLVWTGFRCDPPQYWRRAVQRVGLTAGDDAHGTRTSHVRSEDLERPFGRFALSTFLPFGDVPLVDLAGDEFRMLLSVSVEVDGELVALWTQRLRDRIPRPRVAEDGGEEYPGRRSDAESIRFLPGPVVTTPAAPAPEGPVCQVCGDLAGAGCVPCSRCDIPQHPACWTYVGRCAVFGCGGRPAR